MAPEALRIALVGAESTGKTTLAQALPARIEALSGLRCALVSERLRAWCDTMGRTPLRHEQAAIAEAQHKAIEQAAARHDVVVCDTTALMTAVYSELIFDDTSLTAAAIAWQRRCQLTLLTAIDLPWVADGHQRDGPQVRAPVDARLRALLQQHGIGFNVVAGQGERRLAHALETITPLLKGRSPREPGLFTRLAGRGRADARPGWRCDCC